MIEVRRLVVAGALLGVAAIFGFTSIRGGPGGDPSDKEKESELRAWRRGESVIQPVGEDAGPEEDRSKNRFSDLPAVTYQTVAGETLVALQVLPTLPDEAVRPTDYLVIVDTSASKAMGHLDAAKAMVEELRKKLGADDRLAVWTANIKPTDLTRGFKSGKDLDAAMKDLQAEVPLGAVDLERCVSAAADTFEPKASRRRALVFLGDGKSVASPLGAEGREKLCQMLVKKQAGFFAVPLGPTIDPANLHGLCVGTGGKCVRQGVKEKAEDLIPRLVKEVAEPILYPAEFSLPASVTEALPATMPPMRRGVPTLVVGKLKADMKLINEVTWRVAGEAGGKAVRTEATLKVPAPDEDHFFLVGMHGQWKAKKDQPALLAADRALGYAHKQNLLALEDVISKGDSALEKDNLDAAKKLYMKAHDFAPHSRAAQAGLRMVDQLRSGKKTRAQILAELRLDGGKHRREITRVVDGKRRVEVLADGDEKKDVAPADEPARDPIADVRARKRIAAQQAEALVAEAVQQANRLVHADPDRAYSLLKDTLDGLRGNTDLDPKDAAALSTRLVRSMESVSRVGSLIKRDAAEAAALRAAADARLDVRRTESMAQERVRERMRVFHNLMDQARELEASRQAQAIRDDLVNQGQAVPPAVSAAYRIGQSAYHLREQRDMRRVREERFLAVLLEVDRSHIPFPDEPPIEFPSSAMIKIMTRGRFDNWTDFSKYRIARYNVASFGADVPGRFMELQRLLNTTINFDPEAEGVDPKDSKLGGILDYLAKKYKFQIAFEKRAFREPETGAPRDPEAFEVRKLPTGRMSLGGLLKRILAETTFASPLTYMIRRDEIEITTEEIQRAEKALRVYPAADLVYPTLNAFNPQAVQQTQQIGQLGGQLGGALGGQLGGQFGLGGGLNLGALGGQIGQLGQLGALGALGAVGQLGQLGALGAVGQLGQLGAVGGQLGQLGQLGQMGLGQMGAVGFNCQGAVNMGVGGGILGFTGGQLGQLGNLGGQFGLQGGNQSQQLITLIRQVVGKPRDWMTQYNPVTGQPCNPLDDEKTDGAEVLGENNQIGFYQPAFALVVKGTTRLHTQESNVVFQKVGAGAPGDKGVAAPGGGKDPLAKGPKGPKGPAVIEVADAGDAREIWEAALKKGTQEPGMIIATADFLVLNKKWDHAAEFLKANLRQGFVVQPWVFKSLSVAMRESGAKADDIERAEVSIADMEPLDAHGYLVAARALAEDKNYARAIGFCKQAAELEPGTANPFSEAARYAEMAGDATALEWAAGNLLKQDWPVRNDEIKQTALGRVEALARKADKVTAERLKSGVAGKQRRDLVVKLVWQGEADLDLKVMEPTGSICSALGRQSIGGGTLIADSLTGATTETYAAGEAFSGEYKVTVDRVWGKPLGGKAQIKIVRHQGTKDETETLIPIKIDTDSTAPIAFTLEGGRRTETAYVPPPSAHVMPEDETVTRDGSDQVLSKLARYSESEVTGVEKGFSAAVGGNPGGPRVAPEVEAPRSLDKNRTMYQSRVRSLVNSGVDTTAQAVLSADRRSVRVSLQPVFSTMTDTKPVKVTSPVVPGAGLAP